jgi:hypothetical protein
MCIRYPFLYPRNRVTGLHYNDCKIRNFLCRIYTDAYIHGTRKTWFRPKVANIWYAFLFKALSFYHDYVLQWIHCIPTYTEWDMFDEYGWKKAFGDELLKELKSAIIEDGGLRCLYSVRIMQIKEKHGRLEIYLNMYGDKTLKVIRKYREISWHTCVECGAPAVGITTAYILPYCEHCRKKMEKEIEARTPGRKWFMFFDEYDGLENGSNQSN